MGNVFPVVEDDCEADGSGVGHLGEAGGEVLEHGVYVGGCVVVSMRL